MQAALDLAPESPGNKIRLGGGGILSIAVLGSRWFRAIGVDPASLTLGDEDGLDTPIAPSKSKPLAKRGADVASVVP
jgi:hypothetical protein